MHLSQLYTRGEWTGVPACIFPRRNLFEFYSCALCSYWRAYHAYTAYLSIQSLHILTGHEALIYDQIVIRNAKLDVVVYIINELFRSLVVL